MCAKTKRNVQHSVIAIRRAPCYSPNSEGKDTAIMNAVSSRLRQRGFSVSEFVEDDPSLPAALENSGACISMARSPQALRQLEVLESSGMTVLNTLASVRLCCHRSLLLASLQRAGVPLASADWSDGGFWVKRGDASAQSAADVQFAADSVEVERLTAALHQRGISDVVVSPHISGDLVKFYGVEGTGFFRTCYPGDDGDTKFGDEQVNGRPCHYDYDAALLEREARRAAQVAGVQVFGGDAVIRKDGTFCMIDLNDWPSFSRCRESAAEAIAARFIQIMEQK